MIDLKRENAVAALRELGVADADEILGLYCQSGAFLALEKGEITAGEFFDEIRRICGRSNEEPVSDLEIQEAFNRFFIGIPLSRLETLRKLRREGYRLFVLSNTNPVMYHSWIKKAFMQEGLHVNDYFDGIVLSYEEGKCKPDPELFATVPRRYGLIPSETVMLDDSEANCKAAESVGLKSVVIGNAPGTDMDAVARKIMEGTVIAEEK